LASISQSKENDISDVKDDTAGMTLHNLCFRAFCQATEDEAKVRTALLFASGGKDEKVKRTKCEGYHGNPIVILDIYIESSRAIKSFFQRLLEVDRKALLEDLERRVDEDCAFYFRLDKQEAYLGRLALGEKGEENDIIAVHGKIKSYPKSRDSSLRSMAEYLSSFDSG
jgi:RNA binding exosome subunit